MKQKHQKILFCVTGLTPQIVTETLYALCVTNQTRWVPNKVVVLTTVTGREAIRAQLLAETAGQFAAFCESYGLSNQIEFDLSCVELVCDEHGNPLADIRSENDNARVADAITRCVRELVASSESLHVSIAGGRKTMGYYAGSALSLWGRAQDALSHVLVNEPFEQVSNFYFPPPKPTLFKLRNGDEVSSETATVTLASIPFLRLGGLLPPQSLPNEASLTEIIARYQQSLQPAWVRIDLNNKIIESPVGVIKLEPQLFATYAWFALVRKFAHGEDGAVAITNTAFFKSYSNFCLSFQTKKLGDRSLKRFIEDNDFKSANKLISEKTSQIKRAIDKTLVGVAADAYYIALTNRDKGLRKISLSPAQIEFAGLNDLHTIFNL